MAKHKGGNFVSTLVSVWNVLVPLIAISGLIVGSIGLDKAINNNCECNGISSVNGTSVSLESLEFQNEYIENVTSLYPGLNTTQTTITARYLMNTTLNQVSYLLPNYVQILFERYGDIVVMTTYDYVSTANATFGSFLYSNDYVPDVFIPKAQGNPGEPMNGSYAMFIFFNSNAPGGTAYLRWRVLSSGLVQFDTAIEQDSVDFGGAIEWWSYSNTYSVYSAQEYLD
jgi:hypothetical protein